MTKLINIAVIGLGNIAKQHIDNIVSGNVKGAKLGALCSRSGTDLAAEHGVAYFTDYRALLASDKVEAVILISTKNR